MTNRLVIFGNRVYAEIVWDYFSRDSDYEVVGFTVDADYISETTFCGLRWFLSRRLKNTFHRRKTICTSRSFTGI